MNKESFQFEYQVFDSIEELNEKDRELLQHAREATLLAYAPYSEFHVGAAARMENGEVISGGNQENASFPAGLCAEGVVMAIASSKFQNLPIQAMAVTYRSVKVPGDHPISPCGICRQSLQEYKERTGSPIRMIMGGPEGKIYVLNDSSLLLPFAFRF